MGSGISIGWTGWFLNRILSFIAHLLYISTPKPDAIDLFLSLAPSEVISNREMVYDFWFPLLQRFSRALLLLDHYSSSHVPYLESRQGSARFHQDPPEVFAPAHADLDQVI